MTGQARIVQGDALRLPLPDASVHAVVCDPPYSLSFMGRKWDSFGGPRAYQAWCEQWATEALRVLRPGGWLLSFGGTRTWHRLACAVEDAGFEMRDTIANFGPLAWVYGSGFPKSLDVGKAIDKMAEVNIETSRRIAAVGELIRQHREAKGLTPQQVSQAIVGTPSGACWNWEHHQLPSLAYWPAIKALLGIPDQFDALLEGDRSRYIAAERDVIGSKLGRPGYADTPTTGRMLPTRTHGNGPGYLDDTAPATPEAERWQGWGTALKPAWEPVIVARKPLVGSVAQNVLAWGTGALNIDATRIGTGDRLAIGAGRPGANFDDDAYQWPGGSNPQHPSGRWPSNVTLTHSSGCEPTGTRKIRGARSNSHPQTSKGLNHGGPMPLAPGYADADGMEEVTAWACQPDCPVWLLDQQSGILKSPSAYTRSNDAIRRDDETSWRFRAGEQQPGYADQGGASRFFYTAKAPRNERVTIDGEGHPTVKPLTLMRWLVRLVTPPGGLILDPFAGSGTTGEAAMLEGFRCILIDKDPTNLPSMRVRTHPYVRRSRVVTNGQAGPEQGSLL